MSFFADKIVPEGLTLDNVLLIPYNSEALPSMYGINSRFACCIRFNTSYTSATAASESPDYNSR